jgi:hypothetical protein
MRPRCPNESHLARRPQISECLRKVFFCDGGLLRVPLLLRVEAPEPRLVLRENVGIESLTDGPHNLAWSAIRKVSHQLADEAFLVEVNPQEVDLAKALAAMLIDTFMSRLAEMGLLDRSQGHP